MTIVNYLVVSFLVYTFGDMKTNPQNVKTNIVVNKQT